MAEWKVVSKFAPAGDQPAAIASLARGVEDGLREQVLLGVTGSGKTYAMAKVIEAVQRPTLVLAQAWDVHHLAGRTVAQRPPHVGQVRATQT